MERKPPRAPRERLQRPSETCHVIVPGRAFFYKKEHQREKRWFSFRSLFLVVLVGNLPQRPMLSERWPHFLATLQLRTKEWINSLLS